MAPNHRIEGERHTNLYVARVSRRVPEFFVFCAISFRMGVRLSTRRYMSKEYLRHFRRDYHTNSVDLYYVMTDDDVNCSFMVQMHKCGHQREGDEIVIELFAD